MNNDQELLKLGEQRAKELNVTGDFAGYFPQSDKVIRAEQVFKLLGAGIETCAHKGPSNPEGVWIAKPYQDADSTHQALLIGIKELHVETREEKLEQLVKELSEVEAAGSRLYPVPDLVKRAKALLEGRGT